MYFRFTINKYFSISYHFHLLDADGLRDSVILHSKYNLVEEGTQLKDRYFISSNQSIDDTPSDIEHLFICRFEEYRDEKLILSTNLFNQLKSITIGYGCFNNVREFVVDGCLDLPSLTQIQGNQPFIHCNMGYVILESMN